MFTYGFPPDSSWPCCLPLLILVKKCKVSNVRFFHMFCRSSMTMMVQLCGLRRLPTPSLIPLFKMLEIFQKKVCHKL